MQVLPMMFSQPNQFLNDPYGWLTNQISHIGLGVFLSFVICIGHFFIVGEYPVRVHVLVLIFFGYVSFELYVQGWKRWDTIEDVCFTVGYGACAPLSAAHEITPGDSVVRLDLMHLLIFFVIATIHLNLGFRWRQKKARHE